MPEGWVGRHKMEGIPRLPWGCEGGMGFWGRLGAPLFPFFLCFLVSAGGLAFFSGLCRWICWWWWYVLRLISPRRKLSCKVAHIWLNQLLAKKKRTQWNNAMFLTIFLACSSQSGVWCVMSKTGMEHWAPSAKRAVQLENSCWERFWRISTECH